MVWLDKQTIKEIKNAADAYSLAETKRRVRAEIDLIGREPLPRQPTITTIVDVLVKAAQIIISDAEHYAAGNYDEIVPIDVEPLRRAVAEYHRLSRRDCAAAIRALSKDTQHD